MSVTEQGVGQFETASNFFCWGAIPSALITCPRKSHEVRKSLAFEPLAKTFEVRSRSNRMRRCLGELKTSRRGGNSHVFWAGQDERATVVFRTDLEPSQLSTCTRVSLGFVAFQGLVSLVSFHTYKLR